MIMINPNRIHRARGVIESIRPNRFDSDVTVRVNVKGHTLEGWVNPEGLTVGQQSFDEFCDNMGYSNDSLKALDAYRACMDSAVKLRKALGKELQPERARIERRSEG